MHFFRSPRRAYTVGFALILALVTLQFVGTRFVADRQELSAVEINLSGRQRMLSQRIGWLLQEISDVSTEASEFEAARLRGILAACVHLMESSHRALASRDLAIMREVLDTGHACMAPPQATSMPIPATRAPLNDGTVLSEFANAAWRVAVSETDTENAADLARNLETPLVDLLVQLNRDTRASQEASIAQVRRILSWNWLLIVALILAEIVIIFRPMAKAVEKSIEDLTEANSELMQSEARLQGFAATAAHQFWETDTSARLTYVAAANPEASAIRSSELIGKRFWEIDGVSSGDLGEGQWSGLRETFEAGSPINGFEFSHQAPEEKKTWWRINGRPVFTESGSFVGYRGTSSHITREREAEEHLRLSERMMALGQLTAGVAHDFNNILAVIHANAELLPGEENQSEIEEGVAEIIGAVDRGASLTSRLMSFGRVQRLSPEPISVANFLSELDQLLNRTLGKSFEVSVTLPDASLYIYADLHQLDDAALNLALNARDAAGVGGKLSIDASLQLKVGPTDERPDSPSRSFVRISFRDNGPGISEDLQKRIFEPFFTTKGKGKGSGLGLSMVYGFVHQSEGFVELESALDEGTTIHLYLPHISDTEQ